MATISLTTDNFEQTITENDIVLVDFWASWCGPCRMFGPVFEEASEKNADLVFAKVDTEDQQQLAAGLSIMSIPTLMIFRENVLVFSQPGALPAEALENLIEQVRAGDTGYLVFKSNAPDGVRSGAVVDEIERSLAPALRQQKHVASVVTPYETGGASFISSNGKIAYAEIQFDVQANDVPIDLASHMRDIVKRANVPDLHVELGG